MLNFNRIFRSSLKEGSSKGFMASLQAVQESLSNLRPSSKRDAYRVQLATEQLVQLKRHFRQMNEQIVSLEEQLKVLSEQNNGPSVEEE
jgi:hypothetical protein